MSKVIEGDSVQELKDFLSKDDEEVKVGDPDEEEVQDDEDESNENSDDDTENQDDKGDKGDKEDKEDEEGEEDGEEKADKNAEIPQYKEINKKYPNLFKDFPNLRHVFFQAKEYRELFPSVEEAKSAAEDLEGLQELTNAITSGDPDHIAGVLDSIKELGEEALPNFSASFLPSLKNIDKDLYYQVITPELVNFTRSMFDAGLRNENDNLKNAALVAAMHFFGDTKIASGEKELKVPAREVKKDDRLETERKNFRQERYTTFYNDVTSEADNKISNMIQDGLDPRNNMTAAMKEVVVEKVLKELNKTLSANSAHVSKMNFLWKKANDGNFAGNYKSKILAAYIDAATEIMPRIRSKVRGSILGIRDRHPEKTGDAREKRVEPKSTAGGGGSSSRNSSGGNGNLDASKIDWKKTSDLDLIRGKVTLKS